MSLKFHPEPGTILVCDFSGLREPEMVKRRPVVVISPRLKRRDGLLTVAPLSTTEPEHIMDYHSRIELNPALPEPFNASVMWVKADMIYNVCFERLELLRTKRDQTGKRKYLQYQLDEPIMREIKKAVLAGLGFSELTKHV